MHNHINTNTAEIIETYIEKMVDEFHLLLHCVVTVTKEQELNHLILTMPSQSVSALILAAGPLEIPCWSGVADTPVYTSCMNSMAY